MYLNPPSTQWHFGYITGHEYVNDHLTYLYLKEDIFHTWGRYISMRDCFIERRHSTTDTPGDNLLDDNLATGPYVTRGMAGSLFTDMTIVVASTKTLPGGDTDISGQAYGKNFSGVKLYGWPLSAAGSLSSVLYSLQQSGRSSCIQGMWLVPSVFCGSSGTGNPLPGGVGTTTFTGVKPTTIGTYEPKNKKLLTSPYCGIELTNLLGNTTQLRYEFFSGDTVGFTCYGNPVQDGRAICVPSAYNGQLRDVESGIQMPGWIRCSWPQGGYAEWAATQAIKYEATDTIYAANRVGSIAKSAVGSVNQLLRGNVTGAISTALTGAATATIDDVNNKIANNIQRSADSEIASMQSQNIRGMVGADTTALELGTYGFVAYAKTITEEYAQIIDDYWQLYGYPCRRVEHPEYQYRPEWSYIKTVGCSVGGRIPPEYALYLQQLFDRGVRFWHVPGHFCDYRYDNSV